MTTYPDTRRATTQATLPPSGKTRKNSTRRRHRTGRAPWWLLIPALAFYIFVVVVPSVRGTGYSFTDWDGAKPITNFIGLDNYRQILTDQAAAASLANTALYAIAITILQNAIGLALALGVHSKIKSRGILQVALFAPAVLTPIVTAYLWKFIFAPTGPLNDALGAVGLTASSTTGWGTQRRRRGQSSLPSCGSSPDTPWSSSLRASREFRKKSMRRRHWMERERSAGSGASRALSLPRH